MKHMPVEMESQDSNQTRQEQHHNTFMPGLLEL